MAFNMGGGSSDSPHDVSAHADINITPFIDVILVLLIVFMVAAPLATVDVPVKLPTSGAPEKPRPSNPVFVTLKKDSSIAVGDNVISSDQIGAALDKLTNGNKEQTIFLRIDKSVRYESVAELMDVLRAAGYLKIGLVGEAAASQ